jgi:hypothetical protein
MDAKDLDNVDEKTIGDLTFFFQALGVVNGFLTCPDTLPYVLEVMADEPIMQAHLRRSRDRLDQLLTQLDAKSTPH